MNKKASTKDRLAILRDKYSKQLPEQIEKIKTVYDTCIKDKDSKEKIADFHRIVHSLSGSSATFGYLSISKAARVLEKLLKDIMQEEKKINDTLIQKIKNYMTSLNIEIQRLEVQKIFSKEVKLTVESQILLKPNDKAKNIFLFSPKKLVDQNLIKQISHFGYLVKIFVNAKNLNQALLKSTPSAIIFNTEYKNNKFNCSQVISDISHDKNIPIIFITDCNELDARLHAVRLDVSAYFIRPINVTNLIDRLDLLTTGQKTEPYRILIIDDDPELSNYHAAILEEIGMQTKIVNDPLKVFEPLIEFSPDLILMDYYMPSYNGHELAKAIRQMEAYFSIPIVFLSMETNIEKQMIAMKMGGDDFLTKPIEPNHLISSVRIRAERMRIIRSFMERDSLTGLLNHTKSKEALDLSIKLAQRRKSQLTFAMIDLDFFKSVNDLYGHPTGDKVILSLARLLQQRLRRTDIVGRYGGEEFAVTLLDTNIKDAYNVLNEIAKSFSQIKHFSEGKEFSSTFSCGAASFPTFGDAQKLCDSADKALYRAKKEGRNRVVVAE